MILLLNVIITVTGAEEVLMKRSCGGPPQLILWKLLIRTLRHTYEMSAFKIFVRFRYVLVNHVARRYTGVYKYLNSNVTYHYRPPCLFPITGVGGHYQRSLAGSGYDDRYRRRSRSNFPFFIGSPCEPPPSGSRRLTCSFKQTGDHIKDSMPCLFTARKLYDTN